MYDFTVSITEELTSTVLQYKMLDIIHSWGNHFLFAAGIIGFTWIIIKAVEKLDG